MRYRLSTLLIAMAWVGLVCLALRSPSYWWSGVMFALVVLSLLTSVLVVIYRSGQSRAMAIGFMVFTAGYLAVERGYWPASAPGMSLPTDRLVDWSFSALHTSVKANLNSEEFQRLIAYKAICVNSVAIVVGVVGGIIAQALYRTQQGDHKAETRAQS